MKTYIMQRFTRSVVVACLGNFISGNRKTTRQQQVLAQLRNEIRREVDSHANASTVKNNRTAVNCLERFMTERGCSLKLAFTDLTPDMMKSFETWHLEHGMKVSYSAQNMRCLRAMLNRIAGPAGNLFGDVRTSNCQTEKRALGEDTLRQIAGMDLSGNTDVMLARDLFMASFYGMGIPLIDLLNIRKSQCHNGHVTYYRRKTHRKVEIEVCPEMQYVIDRYADDSSPFLFPVLTKTDSVESMKEYRRFYQRYSYALGKVARRIGDDVHLTSYMARHSWASIAYKNSVSVNDIAQALGHSNAKITYAYIKDIDISHLSKANSIVVAAILKG